MESRLDLQAIPSPIIQKGDLTTAYRDPAVIYHDGVFRVYHSLVRREEDGAYYWHIGLILSPNLLEWTEPKILTPSDLSLNYGSPGSVIRYGDRFILCMNTYPTPDREVHAKESPRVCIMESTDLENWGEPRFLKLKGPEVSIEEMGRMIDSFLLEDKDEPGKWWCFYKQRQSGVSMSYTYDLETWVPFGRTDGGENACVIVDGDEYVLVHSPGNGVSMKRSRDLIHWHSPRHFTLGQSQWPWAEGRLTAGFLLDLRSHPDVGKFLVFFHGSTKEGKAAWKSHGAASLALAWSEDLEHWVWPG